MHLGVLVHRRIDAQQQAGLVETIEMIMQIGIAAVGVHHPAPAAGWAFATTAAITISTAPGVKARADRLLIGPDVGARRRIDGFGGLGLEVRRQREQRLLLQALGFELDRLDPGAEQLGRVVLDQRRAPLSLRRSVRSGTTTSSCHSAACSHTARAFSAGTSFLSAASHRKNRSTLTSTPHSSCSAMQASATPGWR